MFIMPKYPKQSEEEERAEALLCHVMMGAVVIALIIGGIITICKFYA